MYIDIQGQRGAQGAQGAQGEHGDVVSSRTHFYRECGIIKHLMFEYSITFIPGRAW